jgi:hypothetical protein
MQSLGKGNGKKKPTDSIKDKWIWLVDRNKFQHNTVEFSNKQTLRNKELSTV